LRLRVLPRVQAGFCSCPTPPIAEIRSTSMARRPAPRLCEAAHSGLRQRSPAREPTPRNRGASPLRCPELNLFSPPSQRVSRHRLHCAPQCLRAAPAKRFCLTSIFLRIIETIAGESAEYWPNSLDFRNLSRG
jgi:hypothetical protein